MAILADSTLHVLVKDTAYYASESMKPATTLRRCVNVVETDPTFTSISPKACPDRHLRPLSSNCEMGRALWASGQPSKLFLHFCDHSDNVPSRMVTTFLAVPGMNLVVRGPDLQVAALLKPDLHPPAKSCWATSQVQGPG